MQVYCHSISKTGLAVGDVKEIQDNASLNKLALQVCSYNIMYYSVIKIILQVQWIIDVDKYSIIKLKNTKLNEIITRILSYAEFVWSGKGADENEKLLKEELKSYQKV